MNVRPAIPEDFTSLVPLMKQFASTLELGLEVRFQAVLEQSDHVLVVAEIQGKILGYAAAQGYGKRLRSGEESVWLKDLLVSPEHRRLGVGTALLWAVKDSCKARGARYLEWQSSSSATGFYQKLGLKPQVPQLEYPFFEIDFEAQA
jgi:GNAT superfamily N-acetyltransferase